VLILCTNCVRPPDRTAPSHRESSSIQQSEHLRSAKDKSTRFVPQVSRSSRMRLVSGASQVPESRRPFDCRWKHLSIYRVEARELGCTGSFPLDCRLDGAAPIRPPSFLWSEPPPALGKASFFSHSAKANYSALFSAFNFILHSSSILCSRHHTESTTAFTRFGRYSDPVKLRACNCSIHSILCS
jgi:hypothetical protein